MRLLHIEISQWGYSMFVVTNREIRARRKGLAQLGSVTAIGANSLRLVEATQVKGDWRIEILPDEISREMRKEVGIRAGEDPAYASEYAARKIFRQMQKEKKNLLFFVHGYNNDVEAVLNRAAALERLYGVVVLCFSWPANGGGAAGVADYLSDKRDAKASTGAFDRCLGRMADLFDMLLYENAISRSTLIDENKNSEKNRAELMRLQDDKCPLSINMLVHSMGAYLYKHALLSTASYAHRLLFDNVILAAADTNNADHALWVDRVPCRKSTYITLNENDSALALSRAKLGDNQLARLGHYRHRLDSQQAIYVDFTGAPEVGDSHAYFEGAPTSKRHSYIFRFFTSVFNGRRLEDGLFYDPGLGAYRFKESTADEGLILAY